MGARMPTAGDCGHPAAPSSRSRGACRPSMGIDQTDRIAEPLPCLVATAPSRSRALRSALVPTPACSASTLIRADGTAPPINAWRSQSVALVCAPEPTANVLNFERRHPLGQLDRRAELTGLDFSPPRCGRPRQDGRCPRSRALRPFPAALVRGGLFGRHSRFADQLRPPDVAG